jgi:transcriptional regulator with XRE-family HTH domain
MSDSPAPETPGDRLRALRQKQPGLTQEDVGAAVGISRSHVAGIESGGDLPGRETLAAFATFFEVSVDYILKGGDPTPNLPESSKLVDDPDELTLLALWKELSDAERAMLLKLMKPPSA